MPNLPRPLRALRPKVGSHRAASLPPSPRPRTQTTSDRVADTFSEPPTPAARPEPLGANPGDPLWMPTIDPQTGRPKGETPDETPRASVPGPPRPGAPAGGSPSRLEAMKARLNAWVPRRSVGSPSPATRPRRWTEDLLEEISRPRFLLGLAIAFVVVLLLIFAYVVPRTTTTARNGDQQRQASTDSVLDACAKSDRLSKDLHDRGLCDIALQAQRIPSATAEGRTDAEILNLVSQYLNEHGYAPGQIDGTRLIEAARAVLGANPELYRGQPGTPATDEQVNSAASAYIAAHLDELRGAQGEPGTPGDAGPAGDAGAPGRGVATGPRFERNSGGDCESVVTYTDGTSDRAPAGDSLCPGGTSGPPATTEPPPTTIEQPPPTTTEPPPAPTTTPTATTEPPNDGLIGGLLGG